MIIGVVVENAQSVESQETLLEFHSIPNNTWFALNAYNITPIGSNEGDVFVIFWYLKEELVAENYSLLKQYFESKPGVRSVNTFDDVYNISQINVEDSDFIISLNTYLLQIAANLKN